MGVASHYKWGSEMNKSKLLVLCVFLCACMGFALSVSGQTLQQGEISGTVYDASHSVVPKATVTLSNSSTGFKRTVQSDAAGLYVLAQVPPGTYTLVAEAANFAAITITDIEVHVGGSISLDVTLPVKGQAQTIEVSASSAVETPTAGISQLLNAQNVANLPLNGSDYRDLAQLTPSAQVVPGLRGGIRLGGQQSDYSGLTIDGQDSTNNFFGEFFGSLETKNFTIPLDSVQEFQVVTNGFAPEFGRSTGGLINVVTKSGTNNVHGSAHYLYRGGGLTAEDALHNPSNIDRRNEFGGSVGFPIRKDSQFLFLSTNIQRQHGPLVSSYCTDPATAAACETSLAAALIPTSVYGVSNIKALEGINNQFQNLATLLGHYDWQITPANHFSVRGFYTRNHTSGFTGGRGQNEVQTSFGNTENFRNQGVSGVFALNTVSGRKVNEIRIGISGETRPRHPNGGGPEVLILGSGVDFGQRFFLPINNDNGKLEGQDNFGYSFGKHDMKWGGGVTTFTDRKDAFVGWSAGEYEFLTLADFQANKPFGYIQGFGLHGKSVFDADTVFPNYQTGLGLYWQDKWQLTSRLSVTYGIRYDSTWNPQPQSRTPGAQVYVGQGTSSKLAAPPQRIPNDPGQFGPRIGLAYSLGGSAHPTVIRAAWGLYYAQTPGIFLPAIGNDRGATLFCFGAPGGIAFNPATGTGCAPQAGFPNLFNSSLTANAPAIQAAIGNPGINYVDPSFRNPRVSNLTVGVERQVSNNWTVSAHYAYVHSARMRVGGFSTTQWNRNLVVDHVDTFGRSIMATAGGFPISKDPSIGAANELASFGHGNYHEFVATVNRRFSKRFQLFANYTWSRNFDNSSSERDTDTFFGPQDIFNLNLDYGRNGLDISHQFKAGYMIDLPWAFTLSGTMIAHSGLAYPAYDIVDANNDGVVNQLANNDRPTITSGTPHLLGRYPGRQPNFFQWDWRLNKDIPVGEKYHIQLLADLFNLTNHGNLYSNPDNSAFVNDQLTAVPQPGSVNLNGGKYRVLDQIAPGSTQFAAQLGFKFIF